jgi:hypothetical protein
LDPSLPSIGGVRKSVITLMSLGLWLRFSISSYCFFDDISFVSLQNVVHSGHDKYQEDSEGKTYAENEDEAGMEE